MSRKSSKAVLNSEVEGNIGESGSTGRRRTTRTRTRTRGHTEHSHSKRSSGLIEDVESQRETIDDSVASDDEQEDPSDVEHFVAEQKKAVRGSKWAQMLEKFFFCLGVGNVLLLGICAFDIELHFILPYYYSVKFVLLLAWRYFSYKKQKYHLFLLDFCYWCNLSVMIYLWILPGHPEFFTVVYCLAHAPLLWAVLAFRNSLVFHSIDKTTSVFIHISPALTLYIIRYYPASLSKYWYTDFKTCLPHAISLESRISEQSPCTYDFSIDTWIWTLFIPLACFIGHSFLYFIIVQLLPCTKKWRRDKNYLTSFRFLSSQKGGVVHRFVNLAGRSMRVYMFALFNYIYCAITLTLTIFWYNNQYANAIILGFIAFWSLQNGASFYFHVFQKQYAKKLLKAGGTSTPLTTLKK